MAFYDNFGKKLSQTKDEAAKKARNFSEITRLNSAVSELEREITSAYTEIGRICYQKYAEMPENTDAEYLPHLRKISDNMAQAERHHQRIMELKGLKKCSKCGREISVNTAFCNFCGERQIPEVKFEEGAPRCPKCGAEYAPGQIFCMSCGNRLQEPAEAAEPAEVTGPVETAEAFPASEPLPEEIPVPIPEDASLQNFSAAPSEYSYAQSPEEAAEED